MNSEHILRIQILLFWVMTLCSAVVDTNILEEHAASILNVKVFCVIPFYLQSVPVHSVNCVKMYTIACRRVLSSAPL
jgi:hypothetical protein